VFSYEHYHGLKRSITSALPLKDYVIYSLPEGLWVFCITLTSSSFYFKFKKYRCNIVYVPMLIALIMELFQKLHLTNGRFDVMDITFSAGFWLLAFLLTRSNLAKEHAFQSFNSKTVFCMISYSIVYLAHVTY
jgi:hypothetical protein